MHDTSQLGTAHTHPARSVTTQISVLLFLNGNIVKPFVRKIFDFLVPLGDQFMRTRRWDAADIGGIERYRIEFTWNEFRDRFVRVIECRRIRFPLRR